VRLKLLAPRHEATVKDMWHPCDGIALEGSDMSDPPPSDANRPASFVGSPGLADELDSLYRRAHSNAASLTSQATFWYRTRWILAISASLLATVAGVAGLAKLIGVVPAGILSLGAAVLTSLLTVLNPVERQHTALKLANQYNDVAGKARRLARGFGPSEPTWEDFGGVDREYRALRGEQIDFRPSPSSPYPGSG
jgi:hypothetical protein